MTSTYSQSNEAAGAAAPFVGDQNLLRVREFIEAESQSPPDPVKFVIRIFRGRLKLVALLSLIAAVIFGVAGFLMKTPVYQSEGLIRVAANKPSILYGGQSSTNSKHYDAFVEAEVTYLSNRPVRDRAIMLLATTTPEYADVTHQDFDTLISIKRKKSLITLSSSHEDPKFALAALQALIDAYFAENAEKISKRQNIRESELSNRESELLRQIEKTNGRLLAVGGEFGLQTLLKAHLAKISQLAKVDQKLSELTNIIAELETIGILSDVSTVETEMMRALVLDNALAEMIFDQTKRRTELVSLNQRYQPSSLQVKGALAQLEILRTAIKERSKQIINLGISSKSMGSDAGSVESLDERKALHRRLTNRQSELETQAKTLNEKLVELQFLEKERTALRVLLDETRRILDEVRVESRDALPGVIELVSKGRLADRASEDKRMALAILGGGAGLFLVIASVFAFSFVQPRVRYSDDLDRFSRSAPMLAVMPRVEKTDEAIYLDKVSYLRNKIQLLDKPRVNPDQRGRVIALGGASDNTGTTALTMALGESFAECGLQTLIIDADLLTTDLTDRLGHLSQVGWRETLAGATAVTPQRVNNIDFLPSGLLDSVSDRSVSLPKVRAAIEGFTQNYDLILLDIGDVQSRLTSHLIVSQCDVVALMVKAYCTSGPLRKTISGLERVAPNGLNIIFNYAPEDDPALT